jgi:hypothetical protein
MIVDKEVLVLRPWMLAQMQPYTLTGERRNTGMHVESSTAEWGAKGGANRYH